MPHSSWFKDWFNSPYYHLLYNNRNESEALAFLQRLIAFLKPAPDSLILDVACGKGRHSKTLADMGFDVTGIDLSLASIEEAQKNETEHLHFYQHDMRMPFFINYFDYAVNFFTSFGYFDTKHEHDNALRSIAQSLKKGGVFVLDYLNTKYVEAHLVKEENKTYGDVVFHLKRNMDETHFYKEVRIEENGKMLNEAYTEKVTKFLLEDFEKMFHLQGLKLQHIFGSYLLEKYNSQESQRMILIAEKV